MASKYPIHTNNFSDETQTSMSLQTSLKNELSSQKITLQEIDIIDPFDINCSEFNADMYLTKLLNKTPLSDLITMEQSYYKEIQTLDGEMQTLVYENYNKFIKASETIRQMKFDLEKMEHDMSTLEEKMASIKESSTNVYSTFQDNRQQIMSLSGIHATLQKLQFLFSLPKRLQAYVDQGAYIQAVRTYTKAQKVLDQYLSMASFQGIQQEVNVIMEKLKVILQNGLNSKHISASKLTEYVEMLLLLGEPAEQLCDEFLSQGLIKLNEDLDQLRNNLKDYENKTLQNLCENATQDNVIDILEFIDLGCNNFLSNISLFYNCYKEMFIEQNLELHSSESQREVLFSKLTTFVDFLMKEYFDLVERRICLEPEPSDNTLLVRALDRFFRRLQAVNKILKTNKYIEHGEQIVMESVTERCQLCYRVLKQNLNRCITDLRHALATEPEDVNSLLVQFETSIMEHLKLTVHSLQTFIQPEVTFSLKPSFYENFTYNLVREGIVVAIFRHVIGLVSDYTSSMEVTSPTLLLIFAKLCLNLENYAISRLLMTVDEIFLIEDASKVTSASKLCAESKESAQRFLDHFVKVEGLALSEMVRRSMEGRDWLRCIEPGNVRAVMRRLVEDVTALDGGALNQLFEEGSRNDRSSDSSRRTFPYSSRRLTRSSWSINAPGSIDSNLLSNIQKLFVEKIEIFGSVDFSKVSAMTGIIKIALKTLLECVRLQTFTKFGVQQIQIDTHYLHLYLWRFVTDENVVHVLLDEIVGSAIHRCLDPQLLEPHIVEAICDRT